MLMVLFGGPHFENHCSMFLIMYLFASLKEPGMKKNILLFQARKLKASVDVAFSFCFVFPRAFWLSLVFWMQFLFGPSSNYWQLIYWEFFFFSFFPGSVSSSWHAGVCIDKAAGFIQFVVFPGSYATILVNVWSQRHGNPVLSHFAKLQLVPLNKSCSLPGFQVSSLKNEISNTFIDSNIFGKGWHQKDKGEYYNLIFLSLSRYNGTNVNSHC